MKVKQAIMVDENGHTESYGGYAIGASGEEIRIITKALKVFLDYSPRSAKERVGYESKKLAVEMVESICNAEEVKVRHEPNDEQTDCPWK